MSRDIWQKNFQTSLLCVLSLAVLSGCDVGRDDSIAAYSKKLGPQAKYTGTHLIVDWPPTSKGGSRLSIPREYLDSVPVAKDDEGGIATVYMDFALPGFTPWEPLPAVMKVEPPEKHRAFEEHMSRRVLLMLDRSVRGDFAYRERMRREGNVTSQYLRDVPVGGLERFSKLHCIEPQSDAQHRSFIAAKPSDDSSPPGCRLDRNTALLVSPATIVDDNEGVAISCFSSTCIAHFLVVGRGARLHLRPDQLERWNEIVEPIRRKVASFTQAPGTAAASHIPYRP